MHSDERDNENDPRDPDPTAAQDVDPTSGRSDDPRVDPTPDLRQSDTGGTAP